MRSQRFLGGFGGVGAPVGDEVERRTQDERLHRARLDGQRPIDLRARRRDLTLGKRQRRPLRPPRHLDLGRERLAVEPLQRLAGCVGAPQLELRPRFSDQTPGIIGGQGREQIERRRRVAGAKALEARPRRSRERSRQIAGGDADRVVQRPLHRIVRIENGALGRRLAGSCARFLASGRHD